MAKNEILIFRVTFEPMVFRDIEIAATARLHDFAEAIVTAFGFGFDHAFGFYSKIAGAYHDSPVQYELFADMEDGDSDASSVEKTSVAEAFAKDKAKMLFLFDYGDDWRFTVERIGSAPKIPRARYPRVVKSQGKAPVQYPALEER